MIKKHIVICDDGHTRVSIRADGLLIPNNPYIYICCGMRHEVLDPRRHAWCGLCGRQIYTGYDPFPQNAGLGIKPTGIFWSQKVTIDEN